MEVHHHPHVEKKNFKEYLMEGLMIFLAVSMGFFAENIREHFVNKERESKYINSLVEDLSKDITQLPGLVKNIQVQQLEAADSLPVLLKNIDAHKPANKIYFYLRGITRQQPINAFVTDRTIVQLKNSGEMRLISNHQIADQLIDYYKKIAFVASLQDFLGQMKTELGKSELPLLDSYSFDKVSDTLDNLVIPLDPIYLRSADPLSINNSLIEISYIRGLSKAIKKYILNIKDEAVTIRKLIIDKYELKNE